MKERYESRIAIVLEPKRSIWNEEASVLPGCSKVFLRHFQEALPLFIPEAKPPLLSQKLG